MMENSENLREERRPQLRRVEDRRPVDSGREPADRFEGGVEEMLLRMEESVMTAKKMPFTEQCLVDREEILYLVKMIREQLPEELRQAKWLLQQNRQLIAEARKEAANILRDAEAQMARMIDEHEITQQAQGEAQHLINEATTQSRQIRNSAMDYTRDMLSELENQLTEMLIFVQKNKKDLN